VQRFLRKRQNDGSPDRIEVEKTLENTVEKPVENSVANKDFCIMERMKEVVSRAGNLDMYDKMMFIAAIDQEAKGNPIFLDTILHNPKKLKMALAFIPPLVQSIRERNLKRFEMAFTIKE
jgi:hypothetical protein